MRFRNKIFLSYLIIVLLFLFILIPYSTYSMNNLIEKAMEERSTELIRKIRHAQNQNDLVQKLKEQKATIFFRVSLITDKNKLLYDSHVKRLLGNDFIPNYMVNHPEVEKARVSGKAYHENYSQLFGQQFSYFAQAFQFNGKTYVLRIAFPYQYIQEITQDIALGIIGMALFSLALFSLMTWFVVNRLTNPIRRIIKAIQPYHEGISLAIPAITWRGSAPTDEFKQLADTLQSLSQKVQSQINTLIEERKEKEAILESLVEGVIALDQKNEIIYANPAACEILAVDTELIRGSSLQALDQPEFLAVLRRSREEGKPIVEGITFPGEKTLRHCDVVAAPSKEKGGTLLVLQDKTEHYKIIEMRKEFIANVSHELKTPIAIILGFAETLHDNPGLDEETIREITSKICHNSQRMNHLIKDLLTLADIDHLPSSRLFPLDLGSLLENARHHILQAYPHATITLNFPEEEPVFFTGDHRLLDLAVTNLLENGVKYSEGPPKIRIQLSRSEEEIFLEIADQGIGIPKEDLPHIFQRFYTVNKARSRKMGGSGLGLSIVETIIHKHFGEILLESEIGKGTTFTIILPHSFSKKAMGS